MLAVGIAFAIMMAWSVLFPTETPPKDDPKTGTEEVAGKDGEIAKAVPGETEAPVPVVPVLERGDEQFYDLAFDNIKLRFSSYGAALVSYELLGKRLENRSENKPEDLIRIHKPDYQFMRVWFHDSTYDIPRGAEWTVVSQGEREISFGYTDKDQNISVVKKITIHPEDFLMVVDVSLDLIGAQTAKQSLAISLYGEQDPTVESGGMFDRVNREWTAACYYDEEIHTKSSKSLAKNGEKLRSGQINWGGFDHAYFLTAAAIKDAENLRIDCNSYPLKDVVGGMGVDLIQASVELKNGEAGLKSSIAFYMGPKYRGKLQDADDISKIDTKFNEAIDLGFLAIIAGPLLTLLNFFQGFVINWGLAILLLTIVVKAVTLPWTHKSMKSMKAMARLKPELEKIKEKYKDDKARQNVETMALFKTNKVNPMSGCLPMLLQMPIWFALYRSLTVAGELYQAPFISGWIDDLTLPDPYYIMPVLLTGMMFLQTRLTPSTGSGAQQKILMYGMPIMFGVFSFFFPSGLTLYIFTNTCFTALHHLYMRKTDDTAAALAAAADKVIEVESKESSKTSDDKDSDKSVKKSSPAPKSGGGNKSSSKKKSNKNKKRKR